MPKKDTTVETSTEDSSIPTDSPITEGNSEVVELIPKSAPPIEFKRNKLGLLNHVDHEFNEDGSVNWRKMIKPEFLVVNKEVFTRKGQIPPTSIEGLDDSELIILLGGIKDLAKLRGYTSVSHTPLYVSDKYVAISTRIEWIPNYETDNRKVTFEAMADAHGGNVGEFVRPYLASIAENRGFVRAVRNFLGINIVGKEELGAAKEVGESTTGKPVEGLRRLLEANKIPFQDWANRMAQEGVEGAADWKDFDDIPVELVFELIEKTNKRIEEKKKAKKS